MIGPLIGGASKINFATAVLNLIGDGNSFGAGVGASDAAHFLYAQMAAADPINGRAVFTNVAVSGQSIRDMINRAPAQVDVRFNSTVGVANIYFPEEGTNAICNSGTGAGRTGVQAASDMAELCLGRKAINPGWKIVAFTQIPRFGLITAWSTTQANAYIREYNDILRANYRAMGIDAVADVAALPQFYADPAATSCPPAMQAYMYESGGAVHPNDGGYGLHAPVGNAAMQTLRR